MSTTLTTPSAAASAPATASSYADRPAPPPIPFARLLKVEMRKMFDTRSGLWLMASVGILSALASAAVVLWAPEDEVTYGSFAGAVGIPMAIILPVIAILSVTSEWSQRTGLTTFTLVPHRGRVLAAKTVNALVVAVVGMLVAAVVGALGNLVGSALNGTDVVWDISVSDFGAIVLANVLGVLIGFMLGVVLRSSPAALVGYLVYVYVLTGLTFTLAAAQPWFADLQPWVDFNYTQGALFEGWSNTGEYWGVLGPARRHLAALAGAAARRRLLADAALRGEVAARRRRCRTGGCVVRGVHDTPSSRMSQPSPRSPRGRRRAGDHAGQRSRRCAAPGPARWHLAAHPRAVPTGRPAPIPGVAAGSPTPPGPSSAGRCGRRTRRRPVAPTRDVAPAGRRAPRSSPRPAPAGARPPRPDDAAAARSHPCADGGRACRRAQDPQRPLWTAVCRPEDVQ